MCSKLTLSVYTDKSVVVQGEDTRKYKEELKSIGGKYNANLKTGPGWIFPKSKEQEIKDFIESNKDAKIDECKYDAKIESKYDNDRYKSKSEFDSTLLFQKLDNIEKMLKVLMNKKEKLEMVDFSSDEDIPIPLLKNKKIK